MRIEDWGFVEYETSVTRQEALVEAVAAGAEDVLVFCTHPPVVTLGRATTSEDLDGWRGATFEAARGGRATYHGPGQLVIYPILDLRRARADFGARDIHAYLRVLEENVVASLREFGLAAEARTAKVGEISMTGVWVGESKIASIGIAVRKWVTYHGVAVNVVEDAEAFRGIRPCGFRASVMTSLEREAGRRVALGDYQAVCATLLARAFAGKK